MADSSFGAGSEERDAQRLCPLCSRDNRHEPPSRYSRDGWQLKQCSQCDFLYLENPPPVESLVDEHAWTASAFRESQRRADRRPLTGDLHVWWKQARSRWLPRRKLESLIASYVVAGHLLDVGCGAATHFTRYPPYLIPYGIEIDAKAVVVARPQAEEPGGRIIQADALNGLKSIASAEMQGIVMHSFLEHDVDAVEVLREAGRVLSDDGAIIIKVPNLACWNRRFWHGKQWPGFRFPDHVNYFTPTTLAQCIAKADLRIRRFAWRDRLPTSDNMWMVAGKGR